MNASNSVDYKKLEYYFQPPNAPIIVWFGATIFSLIIPGEWQLLLQLVDSIGYGALFTWAWLEIFSGLNIFRRFLGVIVMIAVIASNL